MNNIDPDSEIILVDKPAGWTSFDVVAKVRGRWRQQINQARLAKVEALDSNEVLSPPLKKRLKVGHAGTLDPFATGLLIILKGEACKKAGDFLKLDKTYEFTARLGQTSTTGDPEGELQDYQSKPRSTVPSELAVRRVLNQFVGEITQRPPIFSAIKINGQRAYKLARQGKPAEIPTRQVRIDRLELIAYDYPNLSCVCDVGSGTYIRSLVEDIGRALDRGAYCTVLRRTRIGSFHIEQAGKP